MRRLNLFRLLGARASRLVLRFGARASSPPMVLILFVVCATLLVPLIAAQAQQGFPGKGDRFAWRNAIDDYNLGNACMDQARYMEAVDYFQKAIQIYNLDPDFYLNLGVAYRKLDEYARAEEAFKQAAALNDKDWMTWSNLANAYLKQDKLEDTIKAFQHTLKCNPPASEKAAIEQDIKDITKILKMRGGPEKATAGPGAVTAGKKSVKNRPAAQTKVDPKSLQQSGWDYLQK